MCTGFNGKVWIKAERQVETILIFNAMKTVVDKAIDLGLNSGNVYQNKEIQELVDNIVSKLKDQKKKHLKWLSLEMKKVN